MHNLLLIILFVSTGTSLTNINTVWKETRNQELYGISNFSQSRKVKTLIVLQFLILNT